MDQENQDLKQDIRDFIHLHLDHIDLHMIHLWEDYHSNYLVSQLLLFFIYWSIIRKQVCGTKVTFTRSFISSKYCLETFFKTILCTQVNELRFKYLSKNKSQTKNCLELIKKYRLLCDTYPMMRIIWKIKDGLNLAAFTTCYQSLLLDIFFL